MQLQSLSTEGMKPQERAQVIAAVHQRFAVVAPYLTEQTRRVWAAAEAHTIGDNPGRSTTGKDSDNDSEDNRFWLQASVWF